MSYLNADPSLKERYILTAIFFYINVQNFTAYQTSQWLFYIPIRIRKGTDSNVVCRWATLLKICVLFINIHFSYIMVRYRLSPWYHQP